MQCEQQWLVSQSESSCEILTQQLSVTSPQAIIESDPMGISLKGKVDSVNLGHKFAKQLSCGDNDVTCMREKVLRHF